MKTADLVDRRAVLHIIGNAFDNSATFKSADYVRIRRKVEALPTAGQWTPCSKKLLGNTRGDRMDDLISRQVATQTAERMYKRCDTSSIEDYHDLLIEALTALPSAQQKTLKYSGDSICVYCMTGDCAGCIYEPMEGVMNG